MSNLGVIIQARTGSTRLKNKMLLPFYKDKVTIEIILELIIKCFNKKNIILATTYSKNDDPLIEIANKYSISIFRGDENNVLKRFIDAAECFKVDNIIRVCADNPFIDYDSLCLLKNKIMKSSFDYLAFRTSNGEPTITTHYGFWAEAVSIKALKRVQSETTDVKFLEHVTNFIYTYSDRFNIKYIDIDDFVEESGVRMTLDTYDDYIILKEIYSKVKEFGISKLQDVIKLVMSNSLWMKVMKEQIKLNEK